MSHIQEYHASCHCGAVRLSISHQPEYMNDCNCSLCIKAGAIWGYFKNAEVRISGETISYTRPDKDNAAVALHSCAKCGVTTHWTLTDAAMQSPDAVDRMGVNMRLFADAAKTGVELRFPDGAAWDGSDAYGYRKEAVVWE